MDALQKAIALAGNQSKLADLLGVSRATVNAWMFRGRVSVKGARAIEATFSGQVTRKELRPDVFA